MTHHRRIILGLDPGVAIVGYAVICQSGTNLKSLVCSTITTPAHTDLEDRLLSIYEQLKAVLVRYQPAEAAMETLFFGRNRTTGIPVAHARGVMMLALKQHGLSIAEYSPSQIKLAVTGYGKANKEQVGYMVKTLLALGRVPRPDDATDAAAVAICHAHTAVLRSLVPPLT